VPTRTIGQIVAAHAAAIGDERAYVAGPHTMRWAEYDERGRGIAAALVDGGVEAGDRVAVLLPDGPAVHACYLGVERAGGVIVGIGARAGPREVDHLLAITGASVLLAPSDHAPSVSADVHRIAVSEAELPVGAGRPPRSCGVEDLWLLNSTSGTTGLPKCVMHDQRRWLAFHELAVEAGALSDRDVVLSALPAPFGFGIWTAHVTPTLLGVPCVVLPRFEPAACLEAIERERVTMLAAVSTQFVMLLNSPDLARHDLSSLRVLFTGGEMVPERRAREFEDQTGARVLQFYGSNETGALSRTTIDDPPARRFRTAGRVIPSMHVRLLDDEGVDVTTGGGPGVAACRGPLCCLGYYGDPEANAELYTADGWMRTGDRCTIDADGYLTVAGRASDFIIRGGKNVSAAQVEADVGAHPAVALAAAVAMPDPVFGERVCVYVELRPGADPPDLDGLRDHLQAHGVGPELWPERLVVVDELPRASGGKVAKGELRDDVRRRLADEGAAS